jgi:cell division protein FtsN
MGYDGPGMWGLGWFGHIVGAIVGGLVSLLVLLVVAGILFLLVRFLLVATTAARIYVAKNTPAAPTDSLGDAAPATVSSPAVDSPPVDPGAPAPKKPKTPKTPPPAV